MKIFVFYYNGDQMAIATQYEYYKTPYDRKGMETGGPIIICYIKGNLMLYIR